MYYILNTSFMQMGKVLTYNIGFEPDSKLGCKSYYKTLFR